MFTKSSAEKKFYLRSFQICSNQFFRGIATSDIEYNVTTFPKELSLKCKKDEDWFKSFSWITIGKIENADADPDIAKLNKSSNSGTKKRPKSALRHSQTETKIGEKGSKKKVAFTLNKGPVPAPAQEEEKEPRKPEKTAPHFDLSRFPEAQSMMDEIDRLRDDRSLIERTKKEIDEIKRQHEIELYGKSTDGEVQIKNNEDLMIFRHPDPAGSINPEEAFMLKPDPIMRLNQCIGMHPRFISQSVMFHRNPKYGSDVIYGTANMIIAMNTKSMKQRFLIDHEDYVKKITMTSEFIVSVSKPEVKQEKGKKKRKFNNLIKEEEVQVIVWDVHSGVNIVSFKPPLIDIWEIFVTFRNMYLVLLGKDTQGRDLILVYDFPELVKYRKVELVARQLSDFSIF